MSTAAVAIVGAGVRGTAALGRLAAQLRAAEPRTRVDIHVIDPHPAGSGAIWRAEQPRSLVMNTVPAQSTVFDDASLGFAAPLGGPSFAEWCARLATGELDGAAPWEAEAAAATLPWSSPSRALYGAYLRWAFREIRAALPDTARIIEHRATARGIARADGAFRITLTGETSELTVDAVLLALGWLPRDAAPTGPGARHGDIGPAQPIDQRHAEIAPGERVAVRGMGMGFTDLLALVTEERGGRYVPRTNASRPGELDYLPSGAEPTLFAGSRSGLPFLAKPDFGAVPPRARLDALSAALPALRERRPLDFGSEVLPLIIADADAELRLAERELGLPHGPRFDAARIAPPLTATSGAAIDAEVSGRITEDVRAAALGSASPWKRALHVFQAARAAVIPLTDFGGTSPAGVPALRRFMNLANLAGSGPPRFRVEQLLAAHRAGVVRFLGPGLTVRASGPADTAPVRLAAGSRAPHDAVPVDRVVDARLDLPDPARLDDPLLESLLDRGLARPWPGAPAGACTTLEITAATSALVGAAGQPIPGLHSVGPLHEEQRRFTIIAPIPNAGSTVLREIDAAITAIRTHLTERSFA